MIKQLNADCLYPVPGLQGAPRNKIRLLAPAFIYVCFTEIVRLRRRLIEKVYDYFAFPVF